MQLSKEVLSLIEDTIVKFADQDERNDLRESIGNVFTQFHKELTAEIQEERNRLINRLTEGVKQSKADEERLLELHFAVTEAKLNAETILNELSILQDGLREISLLNDVNSIYLTILKIFISLTSADASFILKKDVDGKLKVIATTEPIMKNRIWEGGDFFQRVLAGNVIATYDVSEIKEWDMLPDEFKKKVKSAIHIPLIIKETQAVLICTHKDKGFFIRSHVDLAKKFSVFAIQALLNAEYLSRLQEERNSLKTQVKSQFESLIKVNQDLKSVAKFSNENPSPVLRVQFDGKLIYANDASYKNLEVWNLVLGKDAPRILLENINKPNKSETPNQIELGVKDKIYRFTIVNIKDEGYYNIYGRDVTEEVEIERLKSELIANVSHELRTPLSSILGYSEVLISESQDELSKKHFRFLKTLHHSAEQLNLLVNDLLDVAKMEAGNFEIQIDLVALPIMINKAFARFQPIADQNNIKLQFQKPTNQFVIEADPSRIEQVFDNIIGNAIKFSPNGGKIVVKLSPKNNEWVLIEIQDDGMGIPTEHLPHLFDRLYRTDKALGKIEGAGLGLYISNQIVKAHGGKIKVESVENQGSTFMVILPRQQGGEEENSEK